MSLKDKVSFHNLKDLSPEEISKKLKASEFGVSPEEADMFKEFATAAPGSEIRLKILSDRKETPPGIVPGSDEVVIPPVDAAITPEVVSVEIDPDDPTAVVPDKPKALEPKEEEIVETSVIPIDKYAEALQERDSHRKSNSKLGNENRELKAKLAEIQKQLAEKAAAAEPEVVSMEAPIPPSPDDFDEGLYSADYIKAQSKYAKDYSEYVKQSSNIPPAWAKKLMDEVETIKTKVEPAYNYATTEQQTRAETIQEKGWNDMWENTVELQKKLNLSTGNLTPQQLNYYVLRQGNPLDKDRNPIYPASEVEGARNFMKEVPKEVNDNFDKLSKVINSYYNFDGDIPVKSSDIRDEFLIPAIIDKLGLKINTIVPVKDSKPSVGDLSKHQIKVSQSESALPATELGANTDTLNNSLSVDQKIERYNRMAKAFLKNPHQCKKNLNWMAEYEALEKEMQLFTG